MDLLMKTGAIKLKSHLDKFLVSDEDRETVRQSRNGATRRAIWVVERSPENPDAVRLKSLSTSLYLTASDTPFLLGMTGKRVLQLSIFDPTRIDWEPINDGFRVKFRSTKEGKYLRANGGTPPWRNNVTHDVPLTGGTHSWILWDVEPVSLPELGSFSDAPSPLTSFNSILSNESFPSSPISVISNSSTDFPSKRTGMDLFHNAKSVRLKSHHDKYLYAEEDEESVSQDRNGASRNARWTVEFVDDNAIRLKSCFGKYLTASNQPFLLGMTGRKALQTVPRRLDSSVEWEPERVGSQVKIRTRYGNYLRANGGLPPWRNSVTHDVPHRTATQDWVVWVVDIVEIVEHSGRVEEVEKRENVGHNPVHGPRPGTPRPVKVDPVLSGSESSSAPVVKESDRMKRQESSDSGTYSPPKHDGRLVCYRVADERGLVDESGEGNSFSFKGNSVAELTKKLEEMTGLQDILVCTASPLNGKLYPLRLQLPPNKKTMDIVVVPSTSKLFQEFSSMGLL